MPHFKTLQLELKSSKSARTIEGYYSIFDVKDFDGEYVLAGSMKASIERRFPRIPLLYQHNPNLVIGRPIEMHEDSKGVYFKDKIAKTPLGDEVLVLTSDADGGPFLDGVSFGYEVIKSGPYKDGTGLKELDVFEHTLTTFPANDLARVTAVKERWAKLDGLYLKAETISGLAMSTDMDRGPVSVASALSLLLDVSDGNRTELLYQIADALDVEIDTVHLILAGDPACPTPSALKTIADVLAIDSRVLLAAGVRGGCEYDMSSDIEEVSKEKSDGLEVDSKGVIHDDDDSSDAPDMTDFRRKMDALSRRLDRRRDTSALRSSIADLSVRLDDLTR